MNIDKSCNKRNYLAFLIVGLIVLSGCSGYIVRPASVPLVRKNEGDSFKGTSVFIQNAWTDVAETRIPTETGKNSPFRTSKKALSQALTESLARELARRGAEVRISAPVKLSVAVSDIVFVETRETLEFRMKAALVLPGWKKEYEGTASMKTSEVYSLSDDADRLAGRALGDIVRAVIEDADFAKQVKGKQ